MSKRDHVSTGNQMFKQLSMRQSGAIGLSLLAFFVGYPFARASPTATKQQENNGLESVSNSCKNAIAASTQKIKEGRQIEQILTKSIDLSQSYDDYPEKQPLGVFFMIEGEDANAVMDSGELQDQLSYQVINNCDRVSLVKIGVYRTDWFMTYGLFDNGEIKRFDCQELGPGPSLVLGVDFC